MSRRIHRRSVDYWYVVGAVGAATGLMGAIASFFVGTISLPLDGGRSAQVRAITELATDVRAVKTSVSAVETQIAALSQISETNALTAEVNRVSNSLGKLEENMSRIQTAILDDPMKALEVPLLRKDMESIKSLNEAQITAVRGEVERTNGLLIGTIVALALGVLGTALPNLFKKDKKE